MKFTCPSSTDADQLRLTASDMHVGINSVDTLTAVGTLTTRWRS